ncbi:MAG: methyltransferase domain-containing protein [Cyanobacteria bacterium P01_G01_bin.38]
MGIQLDSVVPWGRCLEEYTQMFALTKADRQKQILDCGAGPASFTAEMTQLGHSVIACDPIYEFGVDAIANRIQATYDTIITQLQQHLNSYVWRDIASPEHLGKVRMAAMQQFLLDFPAGKAAGRYRVASVLQLPFEDNYFDLALSSHFLLMYATQLGEVFHLQAVQELCRVAQEVRVFPLLTVSGEPSPWLTIVQATAVNLGYRSEIVEVPYEFQKGGNQMLRLS